MAKDTQAFVVRYWRRRSVFSLDGDNIVNHYPGMVATCEDSVNILRSDVCNVLESRSRLTVIQTSVQVNNMLKTYSCPWFP